MGKSRFYKNFDIDSSIVKEFCQTNKEFWQNSSKNNKKEDAGYFWIGLFMVEKWMPWLQAKLLYAKGREEKHGYKTLVLDWEYNDELEEIYNSYGFDFICVKDEMFKNIKGIFVALWYVIKMLVAYPTGEKFSNMKYKGHQIGHFIYDNCVRTTKGLYTIESARKKLFIKKMFVSIWFVNTIDRLADRYTPKEYLFDDIVYDEGMVLQMMYDHGAKAVKCGIEARHYQFSKEDNIYGWPDCYNTEFKRIMAGWSEEEKQRKIEQATKDINERFAGNNGCTYEAEFIFKNKKSGSAKEVCEKMGLDPNKKNVVIFVHCLSENAHKCGFQLYRDNFSWIEDTLKQIQHIDNVNWILKPHPIAISKYHEEGSMEELYEKYKSDSLFWFPNEYNSALVTEIVDVALTIYGTCGLEYSCLGIPTVHTGKSSYAGFGYTVFPQTKEEYYEVLKHLDKMERLSPEKIDMAKLVFEANIEFDARKFDEYDDVMTDMNVEFHKALSKEESTAEQNKQVMKKILEYMAENDIRKTRYYTLGLED